MPFHQKLGMISEFKMFQKLNLTKKCAPKLLFSIEKKIIKKVWLILDIENSL